MNIREKLKAKPSNEANEAKQPLVPELLLSMKGYSAKQLSQDVISGIIVAIIALPLSIALALASGVGPKEGIYTAIIAGFLIAFFGGSKVQIAGPTAAFATIVAGIIARNGGYEGGGMDALFVATIIAGVLLVLMGLFRVGSLIKFIPFTITTGFTAGIAVTILIGQFKDFFGLTYSERPVETLEKLGAFFEHISTINLWSVAVGALALVILIFWPKLCKKLPIPGSLIAVIAGIAVVALFKLPVKTIGDLYEIDSSLPSLHFPALSFDMIRNQFSDGFTIAILAAIESLLSCVVADGMIGAKHNPNQELVAQGIGNVGSAMFGGIPATGAIARTAANIKNGGRTPVAGIVHALVLVLVLVLLMPFAKMIPMPVIAAILFQVAYNMSGWRTVVKVCKKAPVSDIVVLALTFVLTVVFDLVVAIEVGMVAALLLLVKRLSGEFNVKKWTYKDEDENGKPMRKVPQQVRVYEITGPLFFGVSDRLHQITTKNFTKVLILRMRSVPSLDVTAMIALENLLEECRKSGITLILSHVNEQPMQTMTKYGFDTKAGRDNFCPNIDAAFERADQLLAE